MRFAVIFEDVVDGAAEIRRQHFGAHLDFLERNTSMIQAAGPLRNTADMPAGGLWLVEAVDADQVDRLVKEDPFWSAGLRSDVQVFNWHQVFADGMRL